DVTLPLEGRDVLLVDDIIDTGRTMSYLYSYLLKKNPRILKTCCLLDKPSRRVLEFKPDYVGFIIPDYFVVGYGLDFADKQRCLPYIIIRNADAEGNSDGDADGDADADGDSALTLTLTSTSTPTQR
ncbi:MAG: phosphoribosyltransferase family protein, partial [Calditrichota bacterium]